MGDGARSMKILLINAELGYRGTPRTLVNYARILKPVHEIMVWGYDRGGESADELGGEGIPVVIGEEGRDAALAFTPDVVNLHRASVENPYETEILREFKARGAKCIETSVFGRVDKSVEGLLDLSLQISEWDLFRWNAWKGKYRVPGALFPNPVDTDRFVRASSDDISKKRDVWGITGDTAFVIGRIGKTDWKLLAKPLRNLLAQNPVVHFVHVEDYGGSALPDDLKAHPRVHIQPRMKGSKELSLFYSACDVCVSMSGNGESFGFVNAEAMSCGTPVIALSTPLHDNAQLEMVGNGRYGIVIGRPSLFTVAVSRMMSDQAFCERISGACRGAIVSRYSFEALTARLLAYVQWVRDGGVSVSLAKEVYPVYREMRGVLGGCPWWQLFFARMLYSKMGYEILKRVKSIKK